VICGVGALGSAFQSTVSFLKAVIPIRNVNAHHTTADASIETLNPVLPGGNLPIHPHSRIGIFTAFSNRR
jgi:hypothetical protein